MDFILRTKGDSMEDKDIYDGDLVYMNISRVPRHGDVVAVLPDVYTERIAMKSLVKLMSADPLSTDGTILQGTLTKDLPLVPVSSPPGGSTPTISAR